MPSRNAHSTARPAPPPKPPAGPRIPAATRAAASSATDAALLAARKASEERSMQAGRAGDDVAVRREQGYRTTVDECRRQLRQRKALDRLPSLDDLARGTGHGWREGAEAAYAEAQTLYDGAIAGHSASL